MAASCCGGGGSASLTLPKMYAQMLDASFDMEIYGGYWGRDGTMLPNPPGSDLKQFRLNLGYARRLADRWQASAVAPLVANDNNYQNSRTRTYGPGDLSLGLTYEVFDTVMCVWEVNTWEDLTPATYLRLNLTAPTGVSPFDDAPRSEDVTGRGFYRLEASASVEKTVYPWNLALQYSYGFHMDRPVNREYGEYVDPYRKSLGQRRVFSITGGYTHFLASDNSVTASVAYSDLWEGTAKVDGEEDPASGLRKRSLTFSIGLSNIDNSRTARISWNRSIKQDGWGENFPATEIITIGVSYVLE